MGAHDEIATAVKKLRDRSRPTSIPDYLSHMEIRRLSPRTINGARLELEALERHLNKRVHKMTPSDLSAHFENLTRDEIASSTILRKQAVLKAYFRWAMRQSPPLAAEDPTMALERPQVPERLPTFVTEKQVAHLFGTLNGETRLHKLEGAVVALLYYTGIRVGELVALDVESLDREDSSLKVLGKGNRERRVLIPAAAWPLIERWLEIHPTGSGALFVDVLDHRRLDQEKIRRRFKDAMKRAGIDSQQVTPRILRHTYATHLVRHGIPVTQIQILLGHKNLSTTMVYAHQHVPPKDRALIEKALWSAKAPLQ